MKKLSLNDTSKKKKANEIFRFAHPFFNNQQPENREAINGLKRMTDLIQEQLEPIPAVRGNSVIKLEDVIGEEGAIAIENGKVITFHAVGDTGDEKGDAQELVARAMTDDYDINQPEKSPAFFLHLGDVNYYDNTESGYHAQFYVPYKKYPGKILAIPGNHDGELFTSKKGEVKSNGQQKTLQAFQNNFCQTGDASLITSGTIVRQMVSQPGVYWMLDAPFVNIIGLYSNMAENPGYIQSEKIGDAQKKWLTKTLHEIKKERDKSNRKALVIAVHHPPISRGDHRSSTEMLADIDDSCNTSGIMPDAILAGHSHDYQRFTRHVKFNGQKMEIPFIVAGCGGRGLAKFLDDAKGQEIDDFTYDNSCLGFGYLFLTVTSKELNIEFYSVNENSGKKKLADTVIVKLKSNKIL